MGSATLKTECVNNCNGSFRRCFPDWEDMCNNLDMNSHLPKPPPEEKNEKEKEKKEGKGEEKSEKEGDKEIEKEIEKEKVQYYKMKIIARRGGTRRKVGSKKQKQKTNNN